MFSKTHDLGSGWKATFQTEEFEQTMTLEGPEGERITLDKEGIDRLRETMNRAPVLNQ